jgi:predicted unusual protein kinase regulating ubiquinone biosynthesis (AarF/ABC1/UbiB family)
MANKPPKTGLFSRSLSFAKITFSAGTKVAQHTVQGAFRDRVEHLERGKKLLEAQLLLVTKEARQMKGAFAKVGQILSTYGESFLPPEINAVLKTLQSQVDPIPFETIQSLLETRLGKERAQELEVDPTPLGAASLGQVHRAVVRGSGEVVAIKVRYPGIEKAIDADLRLIRFLMSSAKMVPADMPKSRWNGFFGEARAILKQEVDYGQELALLKAYREKIAGDARYAVPAPMDRYCGEGVICTTLLEGVRVDSETVHALSQERRDNLAKAFVELFLNEFLQWNLMQTDPHFGNYLIQVDPQGNRDRWVLLDFGAVRSFTPPFRNAYLTLLQGVLKDSSQQIIQGGKLMGLVEGRDTPAVQEAFINLAKLAGEAILAPAEQPHDYASSDLPSRIAKVAPAVIYRLKLRLPPKEMLSLDRKLSGTYIHLKNLSAKLSFKDRVEQLVGEALGGG